MTLGIVNTGVPLLLSASFVLEVERVIDMNIDADVSRVAFFISRLIKGLQNLSCSEGGYEVSWGNYSYEIEDIGLVQFVPLMDNESGEKTFHIISIQWTFSISRFFSGLKY